MSAPPALCYSKQWLENACSSLGCGAGFTDEEHEAARPWIISALKIGYRHLDTASVYRTEGVVGKAVRESGIPREEIFVTTKLPLHQNNVSESIEVSLRNAGFDYFDLWLMHRPQAMAYAKDNAFPHYPGPNSEPDQGDHILNDKITLNQTWAEMEKMYESGKVKAIGVSNFSVKNLKKLLETARIIPAVDQVEMHPHQAQPELLKFCREKGIILAAYSPTGYSFIANDPTIVKLAERYRVSPAQISLAWHVARGTVAIPKSTNDELPTLSKEDVDLINTLHKNACYCKDPEPTERDGAFGWTYEQIGW